MSFQDFFNAANAQPWTWVALILNFGVVFVNGWTDAPNAIATAIGSRAVSARKAIILGAFCNLVGVVLVGFLANCIATGDVAKTIASLVVLGDDPTRSLIAVSAAMIAILAWGLGSTVFGFPSSESNALVGGITGAALALAALSGSSNWFSVVNWDSWSLVLVGFFASLILGFLLGFTIVKLIQWICRRMSRGKTTRFFNRGQIVSAALMALAHGIQDGAKFIGVFILIASISLGSATAGLSAGQWWIVLPVALVMFIGSSVGGYGIIKTMGTGMAHLEKYQAFSTDIAAFIGLMLATFFGMPVSTSQVKMTAIVGSGATKGRRKVHWDTAGRMIGSWVAIFPGCALIGFAFTLLFVAIFAR